MLIKYKTILTLCVMFILSLVNASKCKKALQTGSPVCNGETLQRSPITIVTSRGSVVGFTLLQTNNEKELYHGSGNVFLGIPYAQPPIGENRFQPPLALTKFSNNLLNATENPPQCIQHSSDTIISEDCLYLNIYTPVNTKNRYLPVIVYIHGGDFVTGPGKVHDPRGIVTNLVSRDVIVVTVQYRLGALGFFAASNMSQNRGVLDVIEALKFVQQEIINFGGNPSRVTVFGEDSGACLVSVLSTTSVAQGLFNQAIIQSGSIFRCVNNVYDRRNISDQFIEQFAPSCGFDAGIVKGGKFEQFYECIMKQDPRNWTMFDKNLMFGWQITFDNTLLKIANSTGYTSLITALKSKTDIPTMYGICHDEFARKIAELLKNGLAIKEFDKSYAESFLKSQLPGYNDDLTDLVARILLSPFAPNNVTDTLGWVKAVSSAISALYYTGPTSLEAHLAAQKNKNVFLSEINYVTDVGRSFDFAGWKPVEQKCVLPFIFASGNALSNAQYHGKFGVNDLEMIQFFGKLWTDFAKNGEPAEYWAPVRSDKTFNYLNINVKPQMMDSYRSVDRILINDILTQLLGLTKV